MIETYCTCGAALSGAESTTNAAAACESCNAPFKLVCGEQLPDGAGAGDFDARLTVISGPAHVGEQFLLGGVAEIELGKLAERQIALPGNMVSRLHCKLQRIDFGPSRWNIADNRSTNGLFVNAERVNDARELSDGDVIKIGEYELRFENIVAPAPAAPVYVDGHTCPSCGTSYPSKSKICVNCGVDLKTGRSLVMSKGLDEDALAIRADTWIRAVSWVVPFGLFPIASEALGTRKARVTWILFAVTGLISAVFLVMLWTAPSGQRFQYSNLMLWSGDPGYVDPRVRAMLEKIKQRMEAEKRNPSKPAATPPRTLPRQPVPPPPSQEDDPEISGTTDEGPDLDGQFHWYQLFTHALLHGGIMHFAGNMVFFLVFGLRVNELIGDVKMVIVYPLLAAISGIAHHIASLHGPVHPMLGASGAIMGLAGMYFVFFPAQRVHMAIWFRGGLLTGWRAIYKVFAMRGFWLLVTWILLNDVLFMILERGSGGGDGVAHWAHLGGFLGGMTLALILLIARQAHARGGDLLSVILGKRAWALIGKPAAA